MAEHDLKDPADDLSSARQIFMAQHRAGHNTGEDTLAILYLAETIRSVGVMLQAALQEIRLRTGSSGDTGAI